MGTSRSYGAPTSGGWPPLKKLVTQFGSDGGGTPLPPLPPFPDPLPFPPPEYPVPPQAPIGPAPGQLLAGYIGAHGGAIAMAGRSGGRGGGGGQGGSGGVGVGRPRSIGRPVARAGQNLGRLAARVGQVGLATALREFDLADLVGRPADEVGVAIVEQLAGPGSTMDASLARIALNRLRQELLSAAKTFEDVERILRGALERVHVTGLLMQFYGHYLYERFARDFYERLVKSVGAEKARHSVESVRRTIFSSLRAKIAGRDPATVDWRGDEGRQLAERVLIETLQVFEAGA